MIELFLALGVGLILGYLLKTEQHPPVVDVLTNQVEELEKQVEYYKDLCLWHVEEKEKLKREHYIDE